MKNGAVFFCWKPIVGAIINYKELVKLGVRMRFIEHILSEEVLIMAVVTDAYYIPMDIMTKLATGEYRRFGSVVRVAIGPNKGKIVKHLDPVKNEQATQAQNIGAKAIQFAKKIRRGL